MSNFYSDVEQLISLPAIDKKQALRYLIDHWKQNSPVVYNVVDGRCTFEQIVSPVVKENLRLRPFFNDGACCSEKYQYEAAKIKEQLVGILPLREFVMVWRAPVCVDLCDPVRSRKLGYLMFFLLPLIVAMILFKTSADAVDFFTYLKHGFTAGVFLELIPLMSDLGYCWDRQRIAGVLLDRAKFLDRTISEAYQV